MKTSRRHIILGFQLIAELVGTFFLIFAGCAAVILNKNMENVVTLPGIAAVWGLVVNISGAHMNPAVTIAFATCKRFPWRQVPAYVSVQVLGSTLASATLKLVFRGDQNHFVGTVPAGSNAQSLILEFIATFYLIFVISGVATDNRAIGELAGLAIGATISIDILFSGPISGASMNPARSLGPAIISGRHEGIWIYILAPCIGAIAGAWVYNIIRFTDKPIREITISGTFLRKPAQASSIPKTTSETVTTASREF